MNQRFSDFGYSETPKHKALDAIVATAHLILNPGVCVIPCPLFTKAPHCPTQLAENRTLIRDCLRRRSFKPRDVGQKPRLLFGESVKLPDGKFLCLEPEGPQHEVRVIVPGDKDDLVLRSACALMETIEFG